MQNRVIRNVLFGKLQIMNEKVHNNFFSHSVSWTIRFVHHCEKSPLRTLQTEIMIIYIGSTGCWLYPSSHVTSIRKHFDILILVKKSSDLPSIRAQWLKNELLSSIIEISNPGIVPLSVIIKLKSFHALDFIKFPSSLTKKPEENDLVQKVHSLVMHLRNATTATRSETHIPDKCW